MAKMHKLTKGGQTIYPATITDAVVNPKTRKSLTAELSELEENIETYKALTYNSNAEIGDAIYGNGYMSESGRWIVSETTKHICIPIHQYDMLVIKANKDFPCTFAILSDYTINNKNGDNIQFAEGESRVVVNSNSKKKLYCHF